MPKLDSLIVEITGDQSHYQKTIAAAVAETKKAGKQFEAAAGDTGRLHAGLERTGRAALAASAATRAIDLSSPAAAAGSLGQGLGAIPGPVGAIAGAAVGVTSAIIAWVSSANKAKEAAEGLFKEVTAGAATVQQALDKARIEDLTNGLDKFRQRLNFAGEAGKFFGRNFQESVAGDAKKAMELALDEVSKGAGPIQKAIRDIFDSTGGKKAIGDIGLARAGQQSREFAHDLLLQIDRLGMTADAAKRLEMAQKLADSAGIGLLEAQKRLAPEMANVALAQKMLGEAQAIQQVRDLTKEFDAQTMRVGLNEVAAKRLQTAQEFAAKAGVSLDAALKLLGPELDKAAQAQARLVKAQSGQEAMDLARDLENQAVRVGLAEDAAKRLETAQKFAAKAGISLAEAQRTLGPELDRVQAAQKRLTEANKLNAQIEEGIALVKQFRPQQEQLADQVKAVQAAFDKGKITQAQYARTLQMIQAAADKATVSLTAAAAAGSAEALARITAFQERMGVKPLPTMPKRPGADGDAPRDVLFGGGGIGGGGGGGAVLGERRALELPKVMDGGLPKAAGQDMRRAVELLQSIDTQLRQVNRRADSGVIIAVGGL